MSLAGAWLILSSACALASPLFDPFLEKFQVGSWSDPSAVVLDGGFPAGLLTPAVRDTTWVRLAEGILADCVFGQGISLTAGLLAAWPESSAARGWAPGALNALHAFVRSEPSANRSDFLAEERLASAFDGAVARGDYPAAAALAGQIATGVEGSQLSTVALVVWQMRRALARKLAGAESDISLASIWPTALKAGFYDAQNIWVLWVAERRSRHLDLMPPDDKGDLADYLGRLSHAWLAPDDIYRAGLSPTDKSALGAILLPQKNLKEHFIKFSEPPRDFRRQGWWLRGQRRWRRGQAASYERLAAVDGLQPGWRLDVLRRASELRILRGAWVEGLADLKRALILASNGAGSAGQRRRLRQWVEQALVLALAQDDLATARRLAGWGRKYLSAAEKTVFESRLRPWENRLAGANSLGTSASTAGDTRSRVFAGLVGNLTASSGQVKMDFRRAAGVPLWSLWRRWGYALADPTRVEGQRRLGAQHYRQLMDKMSGAESAAPNDVVWSAVAQRFADKHWASELLRATLAQDVNRLGGWRTRPHPSVVPDLMPAVRGSELDRHALMGFCLLLGDMRGIVSLASELPARGLTTAEKDLFLYPLPPAGPILESVAGAANEPALILAIARNESLFEPTVRSRAGALGWMQIMPFHYPQRGALLGKGNWRYPATSIQRADELLTENRRRYGGDPYRTVAAYNAGPTAAKRWDVQLGGRAPRDLYLGWIGYPETRAYVEKVLIDREIYLGIIDAAAGGMNSTGRSVDSSNE